MLAGEEIHGVGAQRPRKFTERRQVGLTLAMLDGVDGLRRDPGLFRKATNAETACLAQLPEFF